MDLQPSPDQCDLVAAVDAFASRELSAAHAHARVGEWDSPAEPAPERTWRNLAGLGLLGLGLGEEVGGLGLPAVEEALVFRVLGRHLAPIGLLATVLAARLADAAGDEALRTELVEGGLRAGVALPGPATGPVLVADLAPGGHVVQDGRLRRSSGSEVPVASTDPSTRLVRIADSELSDLKLPSSPTVSEDVTTLGALLAAAMLVGSAEACRDLAVAHSATRVQFGRPIGANQAVKHRCADMAVGCEASASMVSFAALALRDRRPDAGFHVAAAKRVAGRTALWNARAALQIHGGMGFTWEHDVHLHLTRARLLDRLVADPHRQRRNLLATAPQIP